MVIQELIDLASGKVFRRAGIGLWRQSVLVGSNEDSATVYSDPNYNQRVFVSVQRDDLSYTTIAADSYFGLYNNMTSGWVWRLQPNNAVNGLLQAGRGTISDMSRDTLYNLAPGTYFVLNNATNGPEFGSYGNLLVSYSGGNRIIGLLFYDNGHVYVTCGASSSGTFPWFRVSTLSSGYDVLWTGVAGNGGSVTIPNVDSYSLFSLKTSYNSNQSFVAAKEPTSGNIIALNGFWYSGNTSTNGALNGATLMRSSGNTYKAYCRAQEFSGSWWGGSADVVNLTQVVGIV